MAKAPSRKRLGAPPGERLAAMEQWVDSHETRCAERYGDLQTSIRAVGDDVADVASAVTKQAEVFSEALKDHSKQVWGRMWIAVGVVVAALMGTCAWLIVDKLTTLAG